MTETLPNEQAFPIPGSHTVKHGSAPTVYGLTKREYFAAMAMQGLIASGKVSIDHVADISVFYADSLIKSLNKPK